MAQIQTVREFVTEYRSSPPYFRNQYAKEPVSREAYQEMVLKLAEEWGEYAAEWVASNYTIAPAVAA